MINYFLVAILITFSVHAKVKTEQVLKLDGVVWGFDFVTSSTGVASIRSGDLFYFDISKGLKKQLTPPKVKSGGQGGMLDIKYKRIGKTDYIYYTYSKLHKDVWTTALGRAVLVGSKLINHKDIFVAKVESDTSRHFGSRIAFVEDKLFMTIGDRGERKLSQNLNNHNGTIIRLNLDGTVPADNPFVGKSGLDEIWSYGHRNPQGIDYDEKLGKLYSCEFGPRGGDELNLVEKAMNYGWPVITYGKEYWGPSIGDTHKKGMVQPLTYWTPSISPSGMAIYKGDKTPSWKGHLFLANLSSRHLRRLVLKGDKVILQEELLKSLKQRIRHVVNGKDGHLYISTDSGQILKVSK